MDFLVKILTFFFGSPSETRQPQQEKAENPFEGMSREELREARLAVTNQIRTEHMGLQPLQSLPDERGHTTPDHPITPNILALVQGILPAGISLDGGSDYDNIPVLHSGHEEHHH